MNILLTGGNGFIGKNIREFLQDEYNIFSPGAQELDLTDYALVADYIQKQQISHIIHAATINQKRREQGIDEFSANLKMFYALANCADKVEKIIYFGSGAEFDKRGDIIAAKEEAIKGKLPLLNDYSISKYTINTLKDKYDNIYNLRLFGVYGKYENRATYFTSHLCDSVLFKDEITIRQDCLFDFLYIDDLKQPLSYILNNKPLFRDYNICSGQKVKLSEMAAIIKQISGRNLPIRFLKEGLAKEYTGDNSRIKEEIEWPITNIKSGLNLLYQYYQKNTL